MSTNQSARTFAELLSDVSEAAFECGEWDGDSNTEYDESHNALQDATAAITAEHARLSSQVAALKEALRRIAEHESRADRRHRGMVDASEIQDLQRTARAALSAVEEGK